jgi:hypothetical protein
MKKLTIVLIAVLVGFLCGAGHVRAALEFGPEVLVAAGSYDIQVDGYSVPSYVDWNNDGLNDLVVGQGGGAYSSGKVRVYLNVGTSAAPRFASSFFVQSGASDLSVTASGCQGAFPRVVYWDADARKDLIVGLSDGQIRLYLNVGTDAAPVFDGGTLLQAGAAAIDVGYRAAPTVVDWNNDGRKDLAAGAMDGKLRVYINGGTDASPQLAAPVFAQANGADLVDYDGRLSPVIADMDGDGHKDILAGDTTGRLVFYGNVGTDAAPLFAGYAFVLSAGEIIDLAGSARSRPFVCDWTGDGLADLLVGAADGKVHLFQGVPEPATLLLLGSGTLLAMRKRRPSATC